MWNKLLELKYYCKAIYIRYVLLMVGYTLLSTFVISFRNLSAADCAAVMEQFLTFIGVILFVPVVAGELDDKVRELLRSKSMNTLSMYAMRLVLATIISIIVIVIFEVLFALGNSSFDTYKLFLGSLAEILFMGAIAFFFTAVFTTSILGYMVPIVYYILNFGGINFGVLALFQMRKGIYTFSLPMLVTSLAIFLAGCIISTRRQFYH